ncbi:stage VI sporulation protein F [Paenibacillus sp. N1-5-1-14]|uniref:stage VI sporulation protein F n=1 Tax=Paenibacillus radicibacter TaxID=2972488 RepID=UPI0021592F5D|nr:stage VI sporulation protein F [Paenibacillus radicibacter]MCR8641699.1 stage VI sporulation protein F [Paenibacillus radicibacter]
MGYQKYGVDSILVERIKKKLKNPDIKEKIKQLLDGVTKSDLQDRVKVTKLLNQASKILGENLSTTQSNNIVDFVVAQKIDPNNTFHLIKLWGMFR